MSNQTKYWETIIERYKSSGLSQPEFCKQQGLSWNQFQYRWSRHNLAVKPKSRIGALETKMTSSFEAITIASPSVALKQVTNIIEIAIHLPNAIRCDVKIDLTTDEFSMLLKQLVALC